MSRRLRDHFCLSDIAGKLPNLWFITEGCVELYFRSAGPRVVEAFQDLESRVHNVLVTAPAVGQRTDMSVWEVLGKPQNEFRAGSSKTIDALSVIAHNEQALPRLPAEVLDESELSRVDVLVFINQQVLGSRLEVRQNIRIVFQDPTRE